MSLILFLLALLFVIVSIRYKLKLKAARKQGFREEQVHSDKILTDLFMSLFHSHKGIENQ